MFYKVNYFLEKCFLLIDDSVYPRASHSSVIVGNWMWVYDGFTLLPIGNTRRKHLSRYEENT